MSGFFYNIRKILILTFIRKFRGRGTFKGYYPNGTPKESIQYKNGKVNGEYCLWYPNGKLEIAAEFVDGKFDGRYRKWDEQGDLLIEKKFSNGSLIGTLFEKEVEAVSKKPIADEADLIQKISLRMAAMLLIVAEVSENREKLLFEHVRTALKRFVFLDLKNEDLMQEIEVMNGILKSEKENEWMSKFISKTAEASQNILQEHERRNILRTALTIAMFDGIGSSTQNIMGIIGQSLGYSVDEFKKETTDIMKEFGIS